MKAKITWHVLIISFFLAASCYAQDTANVDDIVMKMKKELNLTQQQADAVKPIIEENMAKREEFRQSVENQSMIIDKAAIQDKFEQLGEEESQKLSQVLTQDQMNKWTQKQRLRNAFNQDQMNNSRWSPKDEKYGPGMNF